MSKLNKTPVIAVGLLVAALGAGYIYFSVYPLPEKSTSTTVTFDLVATTPLTSDAMRVAQLAEYSGMKVKKKPAKLSLMQKGLRWRFEPRCVM